MCKHNYYSSEKDQGTTNVQVHPCTLVTYHDYQLVYMGENSNNVGASRMIR